MGAAQALAQSDATLSGRVTSTEGEAVAFATIFLQGTQCGSVTDDEGRYEMAAPAGNYTLTAKAVGYVAAEQAVKISAGRNTADISMTPDVREVEEVTVVGGGVSRVQRSAFNAVAVDTRGMLNSTKNLSEVLTALPGMKLRESGGVGSSMQLMLDGFSGNQVKVFIDGVPQEGVGESFGLNNIPVNFADRVEVYKGVVPVGFGTDAIGGVINIVTNKHPRRWFVDASYSYGSFNTHRSYVHFGQTFRNGIFYEVNAFQNYSDNSYKIDAKGVKHFLEGGGSQINSKLVERVKRFHDTYHNEAVAGKMGLVETKWADRFMIGFTYSHNYQDIQTDTRQTTAYGAKFRKGYSLMPSLEYRKRELFTKGLDLTLTVNYNRNMTNNVDTSRYEYNWLGERRDRGSLGEVSYQDTRSYNDNWNGTATANYRLGEAHMFVVNYVMNNFKRKNETISVSAANAIPKVTHKNILGVSYRLMPSEKWNASIFAKYYSQFSAGPQSVSSGNTTSYYRITKNVNAFGYGAAGTYFIIPGLQAKLSYELAFRLPTTEEIFGDEDLEQGETSLDPERSNNVNLNFSYDRTFEKHGVYVEFGLIYRYTKDYIQRTTENVSGTYYGAYANHGRVETKGFNASVHYSFSRWFRVGGTYTQMDIRDDEEYLEVGSSQKNLAYGSRMPNLPYIFANCDASFFWRDLFAKGNSLSVSYDNAYSHEFPLFSEAYGSSSSKMNVPEQFSHNMTIAYALQKGRYNLSLECRNFTDEKLYDNFNLQKAGRAFYGKIRLCLGNQQQHRHGGHGHGRKHNHRDNQSASIQ